MPQGERHARLQLELQVLRVVGGMRPLLELQADAMARGGHPGLAIGELRDDLDEVLGEVCHLHARPDGLQRPALALDVSLERPGLLR